MKVLLDRDHSKRAPGAKGFMGLRMIPGRENYPYPFIKLEVHAVLSHVDQTFEVSVWHPSTGWNYLISFVAKDFPFELADAEIEDIYEHMVSEVDQIFSGNTWETVEEPEPSLPEAPVEYREL